MSTCTPDFAIDVEGVKGFCPAGEAYAEQQQAAKSIPVLACEGHASAGKSLDSRRT
jgi:hypothetical protein